MDIDRGTGAGNSQVMALFSWKWSNTGNAQDTATQDTPNYHTKPDGKIIATGLREQELEAKLDEIFNGR